jgi:uroporphyrin-III C-methyltransferase
MSFIAGAPATPGTVHLIGGGPGDPGLITLRGARLLESCTFVATDRLVAPELVDLAPVGAIRLDVGKRLGAGYRQRDIDGLIVDAARAGHAVVRLKGGDPFVLGRGGEEAAACVAAGVPYEVVPGISSAIAAPAAAGIPVTHRGLAPAFAVVTGHEDPAKPGPQVDWAALAVFPGTLLVLMGVGSLATSTAALIANGRCPMTPAAAIQWGTTPRQRVVEAPLGELAAAVTLAGLGAPATIVIGDVVAMRGLLAAEPMLVGAA